VRSNNQAAEHIQNDVYGEMILTLAPIYFDERFRHLRNQEHDALIGHLAGLCARNIAKPDAGIWEIRDGWQEHTFSNLMCWAGLDRISKIRERGFLQNLGLDLSFALASAEAAVRMAAVKGSLRNGPKDDSFDASLLQLSVLRFPDEDVVRNTVERIHAELRFGSDPASSSFLYRYLRKDDVGQPQSAFLICSFWLVQALARVGKLSEAREVMQTIMASSNELGLFSEHYIPKLHRQMGNFPQAYSHVGQINAAFVISPPWGDVL